MTQTSRLLCAFYAVVALVALYGTWSQNLAYFGPGAAGGASFLADLRVNPASRSISIDIGFFLLAAAAFMVFEARRIGQRFVWIYIAFGFAIAISVTFPLFLLGRELRMASQAPVSPPSKYDSRARSCRARRSERAVDLFHDVDSLAGEVRDDPHKLERNLDRGDVPDIGQHDEFRVGNDRRRALAAVEGN